MAEPQPALRVESLAKRFGGVRALVDVTLDVAPGETLGLIGPNGSGKTTPTNCVSGVFPPSGGRILLGDEEITRWRRPRRARAGVVRTFQSLRLFADLTAAENVEVGLVGGRRLRASVRRERVRGALAAQGLEHRARTPVGALAYGEQRRTEIARALVSEPRVLLLDEPAAGLGEGETAVLRETVSAARQRLGCAVVLIDHDVSLVMGMSDRVAVMHEGSLLLIDQPEAVRTNPEVAAVYLGTAEEAA